MAKSPFWMAVSRSFPFEAKEGIKRQRKAFMVLELNSFAVELKVIFSPNVSYVLSSVSLLHRVLCCESVWTKFLLRQSIFNKRGEPLSLVPPPSFHGCFSRLMRLTQHHHASTLSASTLTKALFCSSLALPWPEITGMPKPCVAWGQTPRFNLWQGQTAFLRGFMTWKRCVRW